MIKAEQRDTQSLENTKKGKQKNPLPWCRVKIMFI